MISKKSLFFITLLLCSLHLTATEIHRPAYLSMYADGVTITEVKSDGAATTLYFHAEGKPGGRMRFLKTTYLSDEQDNRYKATGSKGIQLGEWKQYGKKGTLDFSISFEPLPDTCRVFDCIESPTSLPVFRFYGIREKDASWDAFPHTAAPDNPLPAAAALMDTVWVDGRIAHYQGNRYQFVPWCLTKDLFHADANRGFRPGNSIEKFVLHPDGSFHLKMVVVGVSWVLLQVPGGDIPVLLIPSDHLRISVDRLGQVNQAIRYQSDFPDYSRLLLHAPYLNHVVYDQHAVGNFMASEDSWTRLHRRDSVNRQIVEYLVRKFQLTPTEADILRLSESSDVATCALLDIARSKISWRNQRLSQEQTAGITDVSIDNLQADSIPLDFTCVKNVPLANPNLLAAALGSQFLGYLYGLATDRHFMGNHAFPDSMAFAHVLDFLDYQGEDRWVAEDGYRASCYEFRKGLGRFSQEAFQQRDSAYSSLVAQSKYPYSRSVAEARRQGKNRPASLAYVIPADTDFQVLRNIQKDYPGKFVKLLLFAEQDTAAMRKMNEAYQAYRNDMDSVAMVVTVLNARKCDVRKFKKATKRLPVFQHQIVLQDEEYYMLLCALQADSHPSEYTLSLDGYCYPAYTLLHGAVRQNEWDWELNRYRQSWSKDGVRYDAFGK